MSSPDFPISHKKTKNKKNQQHPLPSASSLTADWSQLPKDLLQLISSKLDSEFYQLRFRSVCSSWRSSVPKNHHHHLTLPSQIPTPSNFNNIDRATKRTIFLIKPPPNQSNQNLNQPWLIKMGPDSRDLTHFWSPLSRERTLLWCPDSRDRTHLWCPLSRDKKLPLHFHQTIDFNDLSVIDLGRQFVIHNFKEYNSRYMEKFIVLDTGCSVLLTIRIFEKIAFFRCGDERWTIVWEMPSPFDDFCVFKGQPIAVDGTGRTVTVGSDLRLDLVAEPVFGGGGDKKFLLESNGELLLVDKYLSCFRHDGFGIGAKRAVRFDVFRLDEKEKKWVEVRNLWDRVLFLGDECAFSASASDLCIGNGNCVIFRDYVSNSLRYTEFGNSVFHLDQRQISPLSDFPSYSKLFWPPPEWVGLTTTEYAS